MNSPADESLKNTDNTINQTKTEKAETVQKITSSEMAGILAVWGGALVGVTNAIAAKAPDQFSLFTNRFISLQYVQDILFVCLFVATVVFCFILLLHLNAQVYKKITFLKEKIKTIIFKFTPELIVKIHKCNLPLTAVMLLAIWLSNSIIILCTALLLISIFISLLFSSQLSITAKLALLPAAALILTAFIFTPLAPKQTYTIKTTVDDAREVIITGAEARGQFAKITTTDGKTILINVNAIISIQPNISSPQKTTSPLSTATPMQ